MCLPAGKLVPNDKPFLAELAEGHALAATRKAFDLELRRLLVRHATRGALLRRLSEAGLWSG